MSCNSTCAICLEPNEDGDLVKQKCCKNKLHYSCLRKWFKHNPTCPLCRGYCRIIKIMYINFLQNNQYNITGKLFNNNEHNLSNQVPQAWIESFSHDALIPLYTIKNKFGKNTFISYYLRQIMLWESFDSSKLILKVDSQEKMYLTSSQKFKLCNMNNHAMYLTVEWIHELMNLLKWKFNFVYYMSINSLILDLMMATIIKFRLNKNMYQSIIIMSIYNTIEAYYHCLPDFKLFSKKGINFKKLKKFLIWSANGGGFWNNKIILFQQNLIEKHVEMFIDI